MMDNHYGGPSGMRTEHLWGWLREARMEETEAAAEMAGETEGGTMAVVETKAGAGKEAMETTETETMDKSNLKKVEDLVKVAFQEGRLEEETT